LASGRPDNYVLWTDPDYLREDSQEEQYRAERERLGPELFEQLCEEKTRQVHDRLSGFERALLAHLEEEASSQRHLEQLRAVEYGRDDPADSSAVGDNQWLSAGTLIGTRGRAAHPARHSRRDEGDHLIAVTSVPGAPLTRALKPRKRRLTRVPSTYAPTPQLAQLMAAPAVRAGRARHAHQLLEATYYSRDANMRNPAWLIAQLTAYPELWDDLERETSEPHSYEKMTTGRKQRVGRDRMPGSWLLIGIAWVVSKQVDIQTWYDTNRNSRVWEWAGFDRVPCRKTAWLRLTELSHFLSGIVDARRKLWHLAGHRDDRVGRHVHFDATFYESHTRLRHACEDPAACEANGGAPEWIARQDAKTANALRQEENKLPVGERHETSLPIDSPPPVDPIEAAYEAALDALDAEEVSGEDLLDEDGDPLTHPKYERYALAGHRPQPREVFIRWQKVATYKHRYVARDGDAGFRIYQDRQGRKKSGCFGGLTLRATDDYTGEEIVSLHIPADQMEFNHFERLLNRVNEILGFDPEVIVADSGHAYRDLNRLCTKRGIALITPFRRQGKAIRSRADIRQEGVVDEYGIPYCKHCGSPGTTRGSSLGFENRGDKQYVRFRCANPHTPACRKQVQRIDCDVEPLVLGALSREQELYWELRRQGKPKENAHNLARARCAQDGLIVETRSKRIGIDFLELRSAVAGLIGALRLCVRLGWLGDYERKISPKAIRRQGGDRGLKTFERLRKIARLFQPRGKTALSLGIAWDGVLPDGWITVKERRQQTKARRGKRPPPKAASAPA